MAAKSHKKNSCKGNIPLISMHKAQNCQQYDTILRLYSSGTLLRWRRIFYNAIFFTKHYMKNLLKPKTGGLILTAFYLL